MADEPRFPPPRPRGSAYREADARVPPTAPTAAPESSRKPVVVTRPEAPKSERDPSVAPRAADLLVPVGAERRYWESHTFAARHPRWTGAFSVVVGAFALAPTLIARAEGHRYAGGRGALLGGTLVMAGLFMLFAGYPLGSEGKPPSWWVIGILALSSFGAVVGVALS